jgi:hypothetical protein
MGKLNTWKTLAPPFPRPLKLGRTPQQIAPSRIARLPEPQTQPAPAERWSQSFISWIHHFSISSVFAILPHTERKFLFKKVTKKRLTQVCESQMLALPIFPGRHQPSIVGRNELNYRVRNGNGWTLILISTNYMSSGKAGKQLYYIVFRALCQEGKW